MATSQVSGFSAVLIRERYHQQGIVSTDNDDHDDNDDDNGYDNDDDDQNEDDDDDNDYDDDDDDDDDDDNDHDDGRNLNSVCVAFEKLVLNLVLRLSLESSLSC